MGSVVVVHRLSCSAACGIFLDQGSNPRPPELAGRFFSTAPPGKSFSLSISLPQWSPRARSYSLHWSHSDLFISRRLPPLHLPSCCIGLGHSHSPSISLGDARSHFVGSTYPAGSDPTDTCSQSILCFSFRALCTCATMSLVPCLHTFPQWTYAPFG